MFLYVFLHHLFVFHYLSIDSLVPTPFFKKILLFVFLFFFKFISLPLPYTKPLTFV